uniref:Peptidyl-prolyl cis-trans isomerase n=1 Tax=Calcidiscus leptoporus TaxID=127549 RepID=A0A6U5DE34_9EUKA|mmetsp:Transcript_13693/g.31475  ORF Transcript_13693/g.31475 Transcript_13693/m.31475 type:complete len:267 (+) Transcript_13693:28-828(+)|eukprot:CAMPEP_0119378566 /NCGR_PEP_ID=MMETSP1334-20130426/48894_1 /TAXON_ID=127549 /ORGANISM="Calcidiscus leptoporus, Strain RCC1130" /LENGTH=266 /DNA_ID=CAMNT_0007397821 /DNA_START=41 /DNA_END=841 /DNA_ORIENTATION=+
MRDDDRWRPDERERERDRDRRERDRRRDDGEYRERRRERDGDYRSDRHEEGERSRDKERERERDRRDGEDDWREEDRRERRDRDGEASASSFIELARLRDELREAEARLHQLKEEVRQEEEEEERERPSAYISDWHAQGPSQGSATSMPARPLGAFSMILIACGDGGPRSVEDGRMRCKKARERILAGSDFNVKQPPKPKEIRRRFADAAKKQSDDQTASKGGDLGEVFSGALPEAVEAAARLLEVGGVSAEVLSEVGMHLLLRTG